MKKIFRKLSGNLTFDTKKDIITEEIIIGNLKELKIHKQIKKFATKSGYSIDDIGNEIGIAIGEFIKSENDESDFIEGIKHGISLTNNTH